jgi:hypothetical protein
MRIGHRLAPLCLIALSMMVISSESGCARIRRQREVNILNAAPVTAPLGVDIDNQFGSVTVVVSNHSQTPYVTAKCPGDTVAARKPEFASAELITEKGHQILRVVAATPGSTDPKFVNVRVVVPSCAGLRIRNHGGAVSATGITGSVDIINEVPGHSGGTSVVMAAPVVDPITIKANNGGIDLRVPAESKGMLAVTSHKDTMRLDLGEAKVTGARAGGTSYAATFNGGANEITLAAGEGEVMFIYGGK